jgi:hypothetical protein
MPTAKQSGRTSRAASRGRSSSNGSRSRTQSRPSSRSSGSSSRSGSGASQKSARSRSSSNGNRSQSGNGTLVNLGISALSATIGVAGGVLLGRTALQRNHKLLGVSVPSKVDLTGIGQQIGEAGRQFGKLASEVRAVREKAEQVGKLLA